MVMRFVEASQGKLDDMRMSMLQLVPEALLGKAIA
jgi:hypothetical protein